MANKISVIIDVAVDKANQSLGSFKKSIADADGAANKFKVGAAGAFDSIKQNAGNMALAAGTALVAFGAKSVAAFQDLALEAGRMGDALGMPVEDISRLMEVAGDLGIETGTLEKVIGKMNQTAGQSPAAFAAIGAEIVKTSSGATDVNATFMSTIDALNRIEDPAKRAAAAQQIFGRSWRDSAELIGLSSEQITAAMASVSDAQVISDSEVDQAREFRDAMDALNDSLTQVMLNVGGALVPALTKAAETTEDARGAFADVDDALGPVDETLGKLIKTSWEYLNPVGQVITALGAFGDASEVTGTLTGDLAAEVEKARFATAASAAATEDAEGTVRSYSDAVEEGRDAHERAKEAIEAVEQAQRDLTDSYIEAADSSLAFRNQAADTTETIAEAVRVTQDDSASLEDKAQASRDAEAAAYDLADAAVRQASDIATAAGATLTADEETATYIANLRLLATTMDTESAAAVLALADNLESTIGSAEALALGEALANGVAAGLWAGGPAISAAMVGIIVEGQRIAQLRSGIQSPSKVFADEVGRPIAEGIAEGIKDDADKVAEAIVDALDDAADAAVDAAEALVDEVQAAIDTIWDGIGDQDSFRDQTDAVARAEQGVADGVDAIADAEAELARLRKLAITRTPDYERIHAAQDGLADATRGHARAIEAQSDAARSLTRAEEDLAALRESGTATARELEDAEEAVSDAQIGLEDATRGTAEAQRDLTEATKELDEAVSTPSVTAEELAEAEAAVEEAKRKHEEATKKLEDAYRRLAEGQADMLEGTPEEIEAWKDIARQGGFTEEQIAALAGAYRDLAAARKEAEDAGAFAGDTRSDAEWFEDAVRDGVLTPAQVAAIAAMSPADAAAEIARHRDNFDRMFGTTRMHAGGMVRGAAGAEVPIIAQAGERVLSRAEVASGMSAAEMSRAVSDGMVAGWRRVQQMERAL